MERFLSRLAGDLEGMLIDPAHPDYDIARTVWNGAIDRKPAAIARVLGPRDVATVLRHAQSSGQAVCVRGGGHSVAGHSVIDGALVIDLGSMREVTVDPVRARARAGGGALWSDVDRATGQHGLATTGGLISHTGVGGLTLGGGIGWLMRKHGLTVDNLEAAEVVLADGRVVEASEAAYGDLFWALRGGGGNFGVVTRFTFALHAVDTVLAGMVLHPAAQAGAILRLFRELTATAADDLTALVAFMTAPPAPFIPPHLQGTPIVGIVVCWTGDLARGADALRPLRTFGPPAVDVITEMPYVALQSMLDPGAAPGLRNFMKAAYFDELSEAAIDALVERAVRATSPLTQVHLHHLGGAIARIDPRATAYGQRHASYVLNVISTWTDPAESDRHIDWARGLHEAMARHSTGAAYINFLGDEGEARVRSAYGAETFARLADAKRTYDPANVFRFNQNIRVAEQPQRAQLS